MRLADLSDENQGVTRVAAVVRSAKAAPNGGLDRLNAQIREFEVRYEVESGHLRAALSQGRIRDTGDVARWLVLLDARDRAAR